MFAKDKYILVDLQWPPDEYKNEDLQNGGYREHQVQNLWLQSDIGTKNREKIIEDISNQLFLS